MPNIQSAYATSPWRVRLKFDAAGSLTPSTYAITRKDSGPGSPTVVLAFNPSPADTSTVDITLSAPLLDATIFTVTQGGASSADVAYYPPQNTSSRIIADDDPEAEAFGIDYSWIDSDPDATGDCPRRRGLAAYRHDLPMRALLSPGDLIQAPTAGGALYPKINSPASDSELSEDASRVESDLRNDPRTDQVQAEWLQKSGGVAEFRIFAKPVAMSDPLTVLVAALPDGAITGVGR